jgi:hypothetical protein
MAAGLSTAAEGLIPGSMGPAVVQTQTQMRAALPDDYQFIVRQGIFGSSPEAAMGAVGDPGVSRCTATFSNSRH